MNTNAYSEPVQRRNSPLPDRVTCWSSERADAAIEFGRFRVLLRGQQLLAGGVPVELGARAFDLLVALLDADETLVTKQELMSRVWPVLVVSKENIKVQVSHCARGLAPTVMLSSPTSAAAIASLACSPRMLRPRLVNVTSDQSRGAARSLFAWNCRRSLRWSSVRTRTIKDI